MCDGPYMGDTIRANSGYLSYYIVMAHIVSGHISNFDVHLSLHQYIVHTCVYTRARTHAHVRARACVHVCACLCMLAHLCVRMYAHKYVAHA